MPKKTARPRPLSRVGRGKGSGARVFRGPVRPVTNSILDEGETQGGGGREGEGAVRCQLGVAVRCKRIYLVQSGRGKACRGPRSTNTGDRDEVTIFRTLTVPTEHVRRECNTREQGHQGYYFTDNSNLVTVY